MATLKKGICVLKCDKNHIHGVVKFKELSNKKVEVDIYVENIPKGKHGIHIHRLGNEINSPHSLCDHFNPENYPHGDVNELISHVGDLGNIIVQYIPSSQKYIGRKILISNKIKLRGENSVYGRSVIVHSNEDDLGRGDHPQSKTTGNSGSRILYGIIGVDDDCE